MAKSKRKRHGLKSNVGEDPGPDISLLSRPSATSVKGIRDVLKAFEEGTAEVHHLLSNECELLYECRVCRSLYRSFLNFITHKRIYCQQQYTSGSPKVSHFFNDALDEDETLVVQDEPVRITRQTNNSAGTKLETGIATKSGNAATKAKPVPRKNLTEILGLLSQKANNSNEGLKRIINLDGFTAMTANSSSESSAGFKGRTPRQHLLHLENLESTDVALKQTVTLGPDGKILPPAIAANTGNNDVDENASSSQLDGNQNDMEIDLVCTKCIPNATFSSRKTYRHHLNSQHDQSRTSFVCPCCRRHFANSWSVHRHLKTIHGKSTEQLRKLRDQIQTVKIDLTQDEVPNPKPIRQPLLKLEDIAKKKIEGDSTKKTELEIFEREMKRCSGCKKRFDRLAAFNYHVRNCQKRHTVLKSKTTRKLPLLRSSSTTKLLTPLKISTIKSEVLEAMAASDSDSTIDPGRDETCVSASNVGMESREHRSNTSRPEQVVTKKIEIQLRRDYNKIAVSVPNDVPSAATQDDTVITANATNILLPTRPILITSSKLLEEEVNTENDLEFAVHDPVDHLRFENSSTSTSSNSDVSDVSGFESEQGGGNNIDIEPNSNSSSHRAPESIHSETLELSSAEEGESLPTNSDAVCATSKSVASIEEIHPDCPDNEILQYVQLKDITINNVVTDAQLPQKSILEGILMKDKQSQEPIPNITESSIIDAILDQRKKPFKKRASINDWNGFEENHKSVQLTELETEPKKKRFKEMDALLEKPFAMLPHNGSSSDKNTPSMCSTTRDLGEEPAKIVDLTQVTNVEMTVQDSGGIADIKVILLDPNLDETESFEQSDSGVLLRNEDDRVLATAAKEEHILLELDDSDDIIEETPIGNSKADIDAEILKVIFEEEDISQTSSVRHNKGTIIMENGTFSLHPNTSKDIETRATLPQLSTMGESNLQLKPAAIDIELVVSTEEECAYAEINSDTRPMSAQSFASVKEEFQSSSTSESEFRDLSLSSRDEEPIRPSSAMNSEPRSFTPITPVVRSCSAMETDLSNSLDDERKRQSPTESHPSSLISDGKRRQSSDLESETPSSSLESLLTRSRPFRNKAKAKNSDFIYDLTDKTVYDDERPPVRSKAFSKSFQRHQVTETSSVQPKDVESLIVPQVMLVRSDDSNHLNVGCVKTVPSASGSSKNSIPVYTTGAATRKSVRVITKL